MSKSGIGRFLAVLAIVVVIGQLMTALSYILFPPPEMHEAFEIQSFLDLVTAAAFMALIMFPGPIIAIILVSVFAVNRIRGLSMIAVAAAPAMLLWVTVYDDLLKGAFYAVDLMNRFLTKSFSAPIPDSVQTPLPLILMILVLAAASFLIIKLVAAAEQSFTGGREEPA